MKSLFSSKQRIILLNLKRRFLQLDLAFILLILAAIIVRLIDLDYNSAFNDEAIYIVIGRMGLFASDWLSYGAKLWMAGLPYIYPTISSLAYETTGILGSRLINVIFGIILIEEVYQFTYLLNLFDKKTNKLAAIIALFLSGFTATGIFVSKLATYDMLSFLLLITAAVSFLKARYYQNGKYYFLSFISIFIAFLTKIVAGIFFAPLLLFSIIIMKNRTKKQQKLAAYYLYMPFVISMVLYSIANAGNLLTFIMTHKSQGIASNYATIMHIILNTSGLTLLISIPALFVLAIYKKTKIALALFALSLVIPLFHLVLHRYATLDKHMYLTEVFLAVIISYAVSLFFRKKIYQQIFPKKTSYQLALFLAVIFIWNSFRVTYLLEHQWKNTRAVGHFLSDKISPGDKLLTENGGAVILILYDKLFPPTDIVTFDWINYSGLSDESAYKQAITDGYFDYVELDSEFEDDDQFILGLREAMSTNYELIYSVNSFEVYEKTKS